MRVQRRPVQAVQLVGPTAEFMVVLVNLSRRRSAEAAKVSCQSRRRSVHRRPLTGERMYPEDRPSPR